MNGSPSSVLTLGLGSWGSTGLLLTLGLGIASAAPTDNTIPDAVYTLIGPETRPYTLTGPRTSPYELVGPETRAYTLT